MAITQTKPLRNFKIFRVGDDGTPLVGDVLYGKVESFTEAVVTQEYIETPGNLGNAPVPGLFSIADHSFICHDWSLNPEALVNSGLHTFQSNTDADGMSHKVRFTGYVTSVSRGAAQRGQPAPWTLTMRVIEYWKLAANTTAFPAATAAVAASTILRVNIVEDIHWANGVDMLAEQLVRLGVTR